MNANNVLIEMFSACDFLYGSLSTIFMQTQIYTPFHIFNVLQRISGVIFAHSPIMQFRNSGNV